MLHVRWHQRSWDVGSYDTDIVLVVHCWYKILQYWIIEEMQRKLFLLNSHKGTWGIWNFTFCVFLISALDEDEWSTWWFSSLLHGESSDTYCVGGWVIPEIVLTRQQREYLSAFAKSEVLDGQSIWTESTVIIMMFVDITSVWYAVVKDVQYLYRFSVLKYWMFTYMVA